MNIDRLLSIHQSDALMRIGAINKQMLIAQYAQCQQISKLQKELESCSNVSKKILENQIKDIKHQEQLKYYKSLAYAMKEAIEYIAKENNIEFQCFLFELYSPLILENIREAKAVLEEISDKEYCADIEKSLQAIGVVYSTSKLVYENSDFYKIISAKAIYSNQKESLDKKIQELYHKKLEIQKEILAIQPKPNKNKSRVCWIGVLFVISIYILGCLIYSLFSDPKMFILSVESFLIFSPIYIVLLWLILNERNWRKNYPEYIKSLQNKKEVLEQELNSIDIEIYKEEDILNTSQYVQLTKSIQQSCPYWEKIVLVISECLNMNSIEDANPKVSANKYDPLFEQVAYLVVQTQQASTSMIQRKFSIGYNRAARLMNQLEVVGIVGPAHGSKPREVLCINEKDLKYKLENN